MTDRVAEAELREIEAAIAQAVRDKPLSWWERADGEPAKSIVLAPLVARRLVVELRRLRALFTDLADPDPTIGRNVHDAGIVAGGAPPRSTQSRPSPTPKAAPGQISSARCWAPSRIDATQGSEAEAGFDASGRHSSSGERKAEHTRAFLVRRQCPGG